METVSLNLNMLLTIFLIIICVSLPSTAQNFNFINVRVRDDDELKIERQTITLLTNHTFRDLPNLRYIRLVEDNIENIEPGAFKNFKRLSIINLNFNKLSQIPHGIFNNVPVSNLYLQGNQIKNIEINAFDNMPDLQELDLSHNKIEELNTGMFINTHGIRKLIFNNNKLKKIPISVFEHAVAMVQPNENSLIDLSDNEIDYVHPRAFDGVLFVRTLLLNNNRIVELDDFTFETIRYVDVIDLSGNFIKTLSRNFLKTLRKCKLVDLSYNNLDEESVQRYIEWSKRVRTEALIECDVTNSCPTTPITTEGTTNVTTALIECDATNSCPTTTISIEETTTMPS